MEPAHQFHPETLISYHVKENWLTRKPREIAFEITALMSFILFSSGYLFLTDFFHASHWMPAEVLSVFGDSQYWRLWTALFAHADAGHLMNNALLFIPLTYLLTAYFSLYLFPLAGVFMGGLINFYVLKSMPAEASVIGMSGVVYWMGATWLTLFLLIDTRKSMRRRFAIVLFSTVVLFMPQSYMPQISYYSHFLGYIFGIMSAGFYYFLNRRKFTQAEVVEELREEDTGQQSYNFRSIQDDVLHPEPETSKAPPSLSNL